MRMGTMIGWSAALGVTAAFAACSLHLDKSKIGRGGGGGSSGSAGAGGTDAGPDTALGGSAGGGTAGASGSGGSGGTIEAGSECDASAQCKSDAACVVGTCNNGNCAYQLCPVTQACTGSSCDPNTQACTPPQPYGFSPGVIGVGQNLGCNNIASRCIAAMGDYVFVGTTSGLKAWQVTNPQAPVSIPVNPQPPFGTTIDRLVSNGKRVLVLLSNATGGNTLSVVWIDLPTNANPTTIPTTGAALQFQDSYSWSYPADGDNFFLVKNDPTNSYPSARLEPPLKDGDSVALSPCGGLPTGANIVGASGTRLIQFRIDSSTGPFKPIFGFENAGGTQNSQYGGDADLSADTGNVPTDIGAHRFASTYNGGLLWATNEIVTVDAGIQQADAVVVRWPLLNSADTTFNGKRSVVIQQYPLYSYNTLYAGPMAQIDANTALVTAALPSNTNQTLVRVVKRNGDTLSVTPALSSAGYQVPASLGSIGLAAGRRFAYLLVPNQAPSGSTPDTAIKIFDPECTGP